MARKRVPRSQLPLEEVERLRALDRARYPVQGVRRRARAKIHREKNRAEINARQLARKHAHIDKYRADDRARHKKYRDADPEAARAYERATNARHRTKRNLASRARAREWDKKNPVLRRLVSARHRARKANAPINDFTAKEWRALCKAMGYRCAYCGRKCTFKELTQDHITPLSKGGSHTLSNILPACASCNCGKQDRDVPKPVQPFLLLDDSAAD